MKISPRPYIPTLLLLAFSLAALIACKESVVISSCLNRYVASQIRILLGVLSSIFPFSLFELFLAALPLLIISALFYIFCASEIKEINKRFFALVSVAVICLFSFAFTLGVAYNSVPLASSLVIVDAECDTDDIALAAEYLTREANRLAGGSEELDYRAIRDSLAKSYSSILGSKSLAANFLPTPKRLLLSETFQKMGILAFYSYASGEININTKIPYSSLPFTLAHEYAHFLGASGEWDASFMAFAACLHSDNDAVKYSGYISALECFLSEIRRNDKEMYTRVYNLLDKSVKEDIISYSNFASDGNAPLFTVTDALNSVHLEIWDKRGKESYSSFSTLVAIYIASISK